EAIGENLIEEYKGDRGNPNSTFRSAIAYSALDEGGLVFGNTGIRAMFNDANELGPKRRLWVLQIRQAREF
ncbi:MAG: hypothetical protein GY906_04205, partial [bacterium]|nr:hypothetical protein [bacterium]